MEKLNNEMMKLFTKKNAEKMYNAFTSYEVSVYEDVVERDKEIWGLILLRTYLGRKQNGVEETITDYVIELCDGMHEYEFFANLFNGLYKDMLMDKVRKSIKIVGGTNTLS